MEKLPAQMLDLTLPKKEDMEGAKEGGAEGAENLTDRQTDWRNPNSDGQIRAYANENEDGKNAVLQLLERFPELQHLDFDRDKGAVLLFAPVAQGEMAVGDKKALIPQGGSMSLRQTPRNFMRRPWEKCQG